MCLCQKSALNNTLVSIESADTKALIKQFKNQTIHSVMSKFPYWVFNLHP